MSEFEAVSRFKVCITKSYLIEHLHRIGISKGDHVLVHSSLSAIGWVCGGANALIEALMEVVTSEGTITMPTQTGHLSEPSNWRLPPVPEEWWQQIRDEMLPFCPQTTATRGMGVVPETFRRYPNVLRSNHPRYSFASWGDLAEEIIGHHPVEAGLDESSPLGRLYELDAKVLMIGVGYDSNTSFHLAEYTRKNKTYIKMGSPIIKNNLRKWATFEELDFMDTDDFIPVGEAMEKEDLVELHSVGAAPVKLFAIRDSVDFMKKWIYNNNL